MKTKNQKRIEAMARMKTMSLEEYSGAYERATGKPATTQLYQAYVERKRQEIASLNKRIR